MTRLLELSPRRTAVWLFAALWAVYLATATWDMVQVNDTQSTAAAAWGIGTTGSVALPEVWEDLPWRAVTTDGTVVSNRLPGATIWGALFYAVLPTTTDVARMHDVPVYPAAIASATAAALAMAVLFLALDELVDDRRHALGGALVFALGTATWSISSDALWTHGPAQLGIALALLALGREKWAWAGLALGASMFARPQVGAAAVVIGLGLAWSRRSTRPAVWVGLGALPGFVALVSWSRWLFDTWRPGGGYKYGSISGIVANATGQTSAGVVSGLPTATNIVPMLLHPVRGVLIYSPWLLPCLPGLPRAWRSAPDWVRWSAIGGLAEVLLQLSVNGTWHGGGNQFGYRLPLQWLTLSAPLLLLAWRAEAARHRVGRVTTALLVGASIVVFAAGSTFADPRQAKRANFQEFLDDLGPNGQGYDPGNAVGRDVSGE